jgi:hypothetical protein
MEGRPGPYRLSTGAYGCVPDAAIPDDTALAWDEWNARAAEALGLVDMPDSVAWVIYQTFKVMLTEGVIS